MKKKKKFIIVGIIALLITGGVGYGVYANIQHQKEIELAKQYNEKVNQEEKQVNDLQKTFDVKNDSAQEIFKKLEDLKLSTPEAKKNQEKSLREDKQKFVELENEILLHLTISDKDKRFGEISTLQTNVKAIQSEILKIKNMTSIFTVEQSKEFNDKLNDIAKSENAQIALLQKLAKERAEKEASAKAQQEAENAKVQEQATEEAQTIYESSQSNVPNENSSNNTPSTQSGENTPPPANHSGGNSGVIPGTNNGVGWATSPQDVPPGAVIQPPK